MQNRIKMKDIFSHPWVKSYEKGLLQEKEKKVKAVVENIPKELVVTSRNTAATTSSKLRKSEIRSDGRKKSTKGKYVYYP
jgi:hypothetical protein